MVQLGEPVSAFCRIGGHVSCQEHSIARCSCSCHGGRGGDESEVPAYLRAVPTPDPVFVPTATAPSPVDGPDVKRPKGGGGRRRAAKRSG